MVNRWDRQSLALCEPDLLNHQHHFASFLASGSVSWMYYADRLMEFPSGVLGVALGTILLPSLSKVLPVAIMMNTTV